MAPHFVSLPPMTSSARTPAASASRYVPPQRPPTPTPDVSVRKDLKDAGPLHDRKAIVTQTDDIRVSRKRKREEDVTLAPDPYSVVREQKSKQSRPATALGAAPTLESDGDLPEHTDLLHGELVSIYAGENSSSDIEPDTLLYEHAVYTENNETLAISTDPSHGVYAECIGDAIVGVFSSAQAVGLLTIRHDRMGQLDTHLPRALADFTTANGSSQGIRIQLGYSLRGYREELTERIRKAGIEPTRTRLGLAASLDETSVVEAAITQETGRWRDRVSALASRWGTEPEIVEIPNEAIHINREGIDLFESEPYAQLPEDLDVLFD